jgi:hypothetical protein
MKIRICVLKRTGDIKARFGQSRNFIFLFVDVVRNQSLIFMRCKSNHYPIIDPIIDPGMIGSTHVAFTIFVGAPRSSHRNAHCDRITGRGWKIDIVEIDIWEEASCPTHCISKHNISNGGRSTSHTQLSGTSGRNSVPRPHTARLGRPSVDRFVKVEEKTCTCLIQTGEGFSLNSKSRPFTL